MTARRKAPHPFQRGPSKRAPTAAAGSTSRLPTFAALLSALAIVTTAADAGAIIRTADSGVDDAEVEDAATDDADPDATPDAAYCDPRGDMQLGGVMVPTRVHGSGCGCGASGDDDATAALLATSAIAAALSRRRVR